MPDNDTSYDPYAPLNLFHLTRTRKPRNAYRAPLTVPPSLLRSTGFFLDNPVLLFSMLSCVLYAGTNHSEVVMYEVSGGAPPIQ